MYNLIREVTDTFSLRDVLRHHTPQNGYQYALRSVRQAISSPEVRQLIQRGELYGYYGHNLRADHYKDTGSLLLSPTDTPMVGSERVIPAARTVFVELVGDKVTHRQQILDTEPGRVADTLLRANIGGWSWAAIGREGLKGAEIDVFAGFDFVLAPNYISDTRRAEVNALDTEGIPPNLVQHRAGRREFVIMEDSGHRWDI